MNLVKGKSGKLNAIMMLVLIFLGFIGVVMLGIFVFGANLIDQTFGSIDVMIGEVNFTDAYDDTLGQGINSFLDRADSYGLGLLFGMIILIVISSFIFKEKHKLWLVLEFIILIVCFIFAVTIQRIFNTYINLAPEFLNIHSIQLINSSKFILNLPIIIPIVWAFIVILSYGLFKKKEEGFTDLGF